MNDEDRARLNQDMAEGAIAESLMNAFAQIFEDVAAEIQFDLRYGDLTDKEGIATALAELRVVDTVKEKIIIKYNAGIAARHTAEELENDDG